MKKIVLAMTVLAFAAALEAAPAKTTKPATRSAASDSARSTMKADLKGLDLFASWDMVDSFDFDANSNGKNVSGTFNTDKTFGFGGQYNLTQFDNGIGLQIGGTYDMSRTITSAKIPGGQINYSGAKPEIQLWTMFGQVDMMLTEKLGVFGGVNYSFPQVKNIPGGSWKGKMGYQFGGSFVVTQNIAVDALMRTINLSGSAEDNGVTTNYDNIRSQGFALRGRYLF